MKTEQIKAATNIIYLSIRSGRWGNGCWESAAVMRQMRWSIAATYSAKWKNIVKRPQKNRLLLWWKRFVLF